jgi:ribosomal protein S12 methylthiotransferase accessory factor
MDENLCIAEPSTRSGGLSSQPSTVNSSVTCQSGLSEGLKGLLQEQGGLFRGTRLLLPRDDQPQFVSISADLGDVGAAWPEIAKRCGVNHRIGAYGCGLDEASALVPSLAEGLERYSTAIYHERQFRWATTEELGADALDLDTLPRCSSAELRHPKCPLLLPGKSARIRWVQGISLLDGSLKYIPAILVYSHIGYAAPGERFWTPISTGCAAHATYDQALASAIREVIERDAISIIWLQRLPLPRIVVDRVPGELSDYWARYRAASADLTYHFFDATTDIGVPTVYSLEVANWDARTTTLVACASAPTLTQAIAKVMCDMASVRIAFQEEHAVPASWDDFTDMFHGSTLMARAESKSAFDFLLDTPSSKHLSKCDSAPSFASLGSLIGRLRELKLEAFAVDLSTDEALQAGMRVVRVILPALQPLSFRYRARFLGHRRLYEAPARMGYQSLSEECLNPWPQPFA